MNRKLYLISILTLLLAFTMAVALLLTQPNQFAAEIDDTVGKIPDSTFNLIIYTDIHHDPAYDVDPWKETILCISEITKRSRIDAFWNLGDIINGHTTTKEEAIAQIREVTKLEDRVSGDFHRIAGNHDNNIQSTYESNAGYSTDEVLSPVELNAVLENTTAAQTEHHRATFPTDYYVDFDELRVVCISADYTTFLPETCEWLRKVALKTDLPVLILSHIPTRPEWGFHNDVMGGELIEAELSSFIEAGGTIVAYIHGHDHGDMISTVTDEKGDTLWNEVCIACSRFHVPASNGTPGMMFWERDRNDATMVVFDVVSIDLEKRKVFFTRFGAGDDREIEY